MAIGSKIEKINQAADVANEKGGDAEKDAGDDTQGTPINNVVDLRGDNSDNENKSRSELKYVEEILERHEKESEPYLRVEDEEAYL